MPLMIKLNRNVVRVYLCLDNGHFITVLYEIYTRLKEGEQLENIIDGFPYFDHLFVSMYKMYLKNPEEIGSMRGYLDISQEQITYAVNKFTKFFVPIVYGFVAFFVITIYVAVIIPMMNVIGDI